MAVMHDKGLGLRLPAKLDDALAVEARRRGRSRSALARELIAEGLSRTADGL